MSRIRTTLDSVTKAVSSTDLISKFSRFKPVGVAVASNHAGKAQKETLTSSDTAATSTPEHAMKEEDGKEKDSDGQHHQAKEKTLAPASNGPSPGSSSGAGKQTPLFHPTALSANMDETYRTLAQHINTYFGSAQGEEEGDAPTQPHRGRDDPASEPVAPTASQTSGEPVSVLSPVTEDPSIKASTSPPPPPPPLPETSSSPRDDALRAQASEVAARSVPEPATSTKKGFTHYLSYPRPSVQAFVGSYIAPLVPKFRADAKSAAPESGKSAAVAAGEPAPENAAEKQESEEDEAKRKLWLQREKVCGFFENRRQISFVDVSGTRIRDLPCADHSPGERRQQDAGPGQGPGEGQRRQAPHQPSGGAQPTPPRLSRDRGSRRQGQSAPTPPHLRTFRSALVFSRAGKKNPNLLQESVLPRLLRLRQAKDPPLQAAVREALALVGYSDPVKGRGIRILAIDGGGTR